MSTPSPSVVDSEEGVKLDDSIGPSTDQQPLCRIVVATGTVFAVFAVFIVLVVLLIVGLWCLN
jgi:hypothetical protein